MGTPILWVGFNLLVLLALALDLGVFHRKAHKIKLGEAALGSALWIALALVFGWGIWHWHGEQRGLEYFTGYVIEKALSVDNLFVFLVIFRTFQVPEAVQHRVLAWGILGALVMRGVMIAAGAVLVARFQWILPVFGIFLVYTGLHMLWKREKAVHYEKNPIFLFATPLFLVLLIVEITDVTFAVDSIPAIFGITRDPFIVYTSNVFAILGLRALYFLLADVLDYFQYLKVGLALVLIFVGAKMIVEPWLHISVGVSLGIVLGMLAVAVLASWLVQSKKQAAGK